MKTLIVFTAIVLTGCASAPRTKWTDKSMRVLIDPGTVTAENYVRIQEAMTSSGKWFVVDRAQGYRSVKAEQNRLHITESDRFADAQKYAIWGRMYGVGAVVVGYSQCDRLTNWLGRAYQRCLQHLAIIDSNTTEVLAAVSNKEDGDHDETLAVSWEETVSKLNAAFPANFKPDETAPRLRAYQAVAAEEAQRMKERKPSAEEGTSE